MLVNSEARLQFGFRAHAFTHWVRLKQGNEDEHVLLQYEQERM